MDRTGIGIAIILLLGMFFLFGGGGSVLVERNDALVGSQNTHNFIEGTNVTLGVVNDPASGEIDITINSTGGVDLIDDGDGVTATTSSESGLELLAGELGLLRGCVDGDVEKFTFATQDWGCAADIGAGAAGDEIEVEDGDNLGTFTTIDSTARFEDQGDINFTFADGGAGGPDTITATVRGLTVASLTDDNVFLGDAAGVVAQSAIPNCITGNLSRLNYNTATNNFTCDSDAHVLATDTDGNFVATIADAGNTTITVTGSGVENAAVTLDVIDVNCTNCLTTTEISGLDVSDDLNLLAGTNITLTGDTLNVDDAFILNTGDIGTGVFDFGGATSFEIVNGAANTVDADGEIAHDITDDQLILGSDADVIPTRFPHSFAIENPVDSDRLLLYAYLAHGATVTDIICIVDPADTGESVVIALYESSATGDFTDLATNGLDGVTTITCDNDEAEDDGSLSNGVIDEGDWIGIDIGTVVGTITWLTVQWVEEPTRE